MRKVFCFVLAALTLIGTFVGCVSSNQPDQGSVGTLESSGDAYEQALSALSVDWGGEDFTVLGRNDAGSSVTEILREEASSDPLEDAVFRRNLNLSELCHLNYRAVVEPSDQLPTVISNDIKSGSGEYDIAFPDMRNAGLMATQNMLVDFHEMPYIDMDADWWDQGTAALSISNRLFWMNSDINFMAHDVTFLTLFSKVMADKQGLDDLYETVNRQEWTLDVFSQYIKKVSSDLDGNGKYDENDAYGLIGTSSMGYNMFYASDLVFAKCRDEEPYLAMTESDLLKATDLLDKLLELFYNGHSTYLVAPGKEQDALKMFINNQGLFYMECASYINGLRNMSDDFGVLPLPKYDKKQANYTTYVHCISSTMVIVQSFKQFDEMSKVIETMAILSSKSVIPTYYELVLKRKTIRDEESAGMLDIIFSNRTYDLANYYEKIGLMYTFQAAVDSKTSSFASSYNKQVRRAGKELEKIADEYSELE